MGDWKYESAEALFVNKLSGSVINVDEHGFSRQFTFNAEGKDYTVVWFKNQSTLILDGLHIMFHHAEISNTWPSPAGSKRKLQMYDIHNNCISIVVLDRYPTKE